MAIMQTVATRESKVDRGARHGRDLVAALVAELRQSRLAHGLSQRSLANSLGWSQQKYSRFERNKLVDLGLIDLGRISSLFGLEPSVKLFRVGDALRDSGHEALIRRFQTILDPAWRVMREVNFPNLGDQRFWDLTLRITSQVVGVEAETRIRDLQALVRRMRERAREGGCDAIVIVLSDSAHNRALIEDFRDALGDEFKTAPRDLLRALRAGTPLPGSGVVLV